MKNIIRFIKRHDEAAFGIGLVLAAVLVALFVFGYIRHVKTTLRNRAMTRAMKMDGHIYTINQIGWNFLGDTRLFLTDENGRDAGWIAMYMNNPLTDKINPLFLIVIDKTNQNPLPMKVRAHFRSTTWTQPNVDNSKEEYTASHLTFEIL